MHRTRTLISVLALFVLAVLVALVMPASASVSDRSADTSRHYYVTTSRCSMPPGVFTPQPVGHLRTYDGAVTRAWTLGERKSPHLRAIRVVNANSGRAVLRLAQYYDGSVCGS